MPEGEEEVQKVDDELTEEAKGGKHPETVSWNQYVGVKESLGKKIDTATQKVGTLEGQLEKAVKPEEHEKIKTALEEAKTKLTETETAKAEAEEKLKVTLEKTLTEKRDVLVTKGMPKEDVEKMSEEAIDGAIKVLATYKPKPDLAGGGGSEAPTGAKSKIHSGFDTLHPQT